MSDILTKIKSTADILGGTVFFANEQGTDPENEGVELLPNGMYIRLDGSDGSVAYISAHEIDKAIGIIGQMSMSKASQADVDAIIELLDEKASKTELELLKTDIADKVNDDDFNDLAGLVANKADKSEVEDLAGLVANKADKSEVEDLAGLVANKTSIESFNILSADVNSKKLEIAKIKNDILAIQNAMGSMSDANSIAALQNQINYLNSELNKKLNANDLANINKSIDGLSEADSEIKEMISIVETNLNKKASTVYVQGQVNELNNAITGISARVDSKADKETMAKKASKTDLESLTTKVTKLSNEFNDTKNEFETLNNNVYNDISKKVSIDALNTEINRLESEINNKTDNTEYSSEITNINNKIRQIESTHDESFDSLYSTFDEITCGLSNNVTELNAKLGAHDSIIEYQNTQIAALQEADYKNESKLNNQWVRVMTPEQYNTLAPVGDSYSDGTPNPDAKQPNVVYMLVRYNKPIAVYIGEILIAQAEQKGSVGFAYTFPISF